MRRKAELALALGLVVCGEPAPREFPDPLPPAKKPQPPDLESVYEKMMDALADDIVANTKTAALRDYESYEEAKAALEEVLPQNSLGRIDVVLDEAGLTKPELAAFMREHPEVVQRVSKRVEAKLGKVEPELAAVMAKVAKLAPPGDDTADRLRDLGYGHLIDGGSTPEWIKIGSSADFDIATAKAAKEGKPLLLHVHAQWCLPCKELERKTFAAKDVAPLLAEQVVAAEFDVTLGEPWQEEAQRAIGSVTLPTVRVWAADTQFRRGALDKGAVPKADVEFDEFVPPAEFLAKLERVLGAKG